MRIQIINGPNLNLLGKREPEVYGTQAFETFFQTLQLSFPQAEIFYFQSNVEGEIINQLQDVGFSYDGIILNAGAYAHTSVAIHDTIAAITTPVVEVHISNIYAREEFRHRSLISANCAGLISGFGLQGYVLALVYLMNRAA
jgi:3-dehydroquinate dehydratase-2